MHFKIFSNQVEKHSVCILEPKKLSKAKISVFKLEFLSKVLVLTGFLIPTGDYTIDCLL